MCRGYNPTCSEIGAQDAALPPPSASSLSDKRGTSLCPSPARTSSSGEWHSPHLLVEALCLDLGHNHSETTFCCGRLSGNPRRSQKRFSAQMASSKEDETGKETTSPKT